MDFHCVVCSKIVERVMRPKIATEIATEIATGFSEAHI
jgi:hypothetical protein